MSRRSFCDPTYLVTKGLNGLGFLVEPVNNLVSTVRGRELDDEGV